MNYFIITSRGEQFETKTPVKERGKIIKWYKQTQTTKQQDGKRNKNKTNKQGKQANIKTR